METLINIVCTDAISGAKIPDHYFDEFRNREFIEPKQIEYYLENRTELTKYLSDIARQNHFYLRQIKELENNSVDELIPSVELAIISLTRHQSDLRYHQMNFQKGFEKVGILVPPENLKPEQKIPIKLGWMSSYNTITKKGEKIINEYRNL
jgi:hypothetical protein